jgi:hypothetical protein
MATFPMICSRELESRIWNRDVLAGPEAVFDNFQQKVDDGFWCFQLVRNPWEVLRNPDLRLNAHYYITKVNLARDRCCLTGFHRQICNKLNLRFAFILNGEGRLVGTYLVISREVATVA